MKAGEISIDLTINDHDFSVKLKNGEKIMSQFARQMETTAKSAQVVENHFSSLSTRFRHFMIMVASTRFALLDINQVFLSLPRSIIQVTGEMERLTKLMEGLSRATSDLARKQEALASVKFVYAMGKEAPFAISALTDAFVKLKSGGIDPMNGSMQALVDSVAKFGGDAQKLSRASIAIQQMAGKGVVSMEELRQQLGEAIPNAIEMMAVGSGKSMSKLVKEVSKGQVEAASALERMFAVMRFRNEGAAAAMMTTWSGMLERLKTEWQLAQIEMGKSGGFEAAKEALSSIIDSFDGAQMRQLGSDLGYVTNQMVQAIGALIRGAQQYYEYIKLAGQAFISYFVASRVASAGAAVWGLMQAQHAAAVKEINRANEESYRQSVQLHEKEVSSARAKYARIQAELNRHVQAVLAAENRVSKVNTAATTTISEARNLEAQARAVDLRTEAGRRLQVELQREAAALRANAASMQSLTAATVQARNAHYEKVNVLRDTARQQSLYIQQLNNTVVSQNKVTGAQKAWATVSRGLGSVFNALGGWLTVVSVALAFGVSKWMDYAQAAERAAQRARDAAAGISSAKALADAQSELSRNRTDQGVQMSILGDGYTGRGAEEARIKLDRLKKEEDNLNEEIKLHRENLAEDSAQHQEKLYLREFNRNSEALKRHYRTLALTEEDEIRKQSEKKLAAATSEKEKQAIRDKQQKDIAEMTRRNAAGVTKDVLTYNEGALQDVNERLKNATDKDRLALEKIREYHETAIADAKARLQTAEKIGSDYNLLFGGGAGGGNSGGAGGEKKTTALEQLLDRVADKLATINGELDKKGSGDLQKIISDLEQIDPSQMIANGKRMTKEEVIEMIMPGLIEGEWRLDFEKSFEQISDTVGDEMIRVTTELDGGRSTIERLRNELNELGLAAAAAGDPERVGRVTGMIDRLEELQEKQSELSFRELSADFVDAIDQVRSSLSDDPAESLYAAWAKDVKSYEQAIIKAKLSTEDASKAQEQFAEYVRLTYERLQRDLEPPIMQLARDWTNTTEQMGNAIADWASDASEALTDFVMEGKADFASLAKSIIRDLIRIQIQAAMGATVKMAYPSFQMQGGGGYSGYAPAGPGGSSGGFGMPGVPGIDMMGMTAKGLSWLGGATGMTGLSSFAAGMGMTSYTSASAMMGLAEAGLVSGVTNATAASAGSLLGAASTAMPYIAAALFAAQALGLFDKKPSDKTSAVTVDTSDLSVDDVWDMGGKKAASQEQKDANTVLSLLVGNFAQQAGLSGQIVTAMGQRDGTRLAIDGGFRTPMGAAAGGTWLGDETAYNYGSGDEAVRKMLEDLIDEGTLPQETIDRWKSLQTNVDGSARGAVELVDTLALINQGLTDTEILRADLIQIEGETLGQAATRIRDINSAMDPLTANEAWVKGMGDLADIFYDVGLELPHTNSEFLSLIDSLDLTTQAGQDAYRALIGVAPAFSNVTQVVMSALDSISKTTAESIRDIEMSLLNDEGKYNYLDDELEGLVTSLEGAFDPAEITSLVEQINSKTLEAWNLLDETQRQQVGTEFLDRIRYAEEISKGRLDPETAANADKSEKEKEESDSISKAAIESATAQKEAAAATAGAASAHSSAASALLSAAQALSAASDRIASSNTNFNGALSNITSALANLSSSEIGGR